MSEETKCIYYGVFYASNGEIMLIPGKSQRECLEKIQNQIDSDPSGRYWDFCKATTVIKRDLSTMKNPEFIFGNPKSLDIKNEKFKMPKESSEKNE